MTNKQAKAFTMLFYFLVVLSIAVMGPFFTIWSLNTLFVLDISYSFKTWCAVIWLIVLLHGIKVTVRRLLD